MWQKNKSSAQQEGALTLAKSSLDNPQPQELNLEVDPAFLLRGQRLSAGSQCSFYKNLVLLHTQKYYVPKASLTSNITAAQQSIRLLLDIPLLPLNCGNPYAAEIFRRISETSYGSASTISTKLGHTGTTYQTSKTGAYANCAVTQSPWSTSWWSARTLPSARWCGDLRANCGAKERSHGRRSPSDRSWEQISQMVSTRGVLGKRDKADYLPSLY